MNDLSSREPLVFVDLETTGANIANDRIIEIGLVEVDANGCREWSTLVNPGRPVSPFITGLTGIDTAMVEPAPTFAQLAPMLSEKLRGRLFIAHNARFDYGFLQHEFKRAVLDFRATRLCTVKLSRALFPGHARHNLDTLVERHDIVVPEGDRHRALTDARLIWALWQHWHTVLPEETIRASVERITGRPTLPPQLDAASLDDLPESPGAYAMTDRDGNRLLVKRATNLRQQIFTHFAADKAGSALANAVWHIEWREAAGELGARLSEIGLAPTRRHPPEELCSWRLVSQGNGDFQPVLALASNADFAREENLFGLYNGRKEAQQALRKLVEAHRLCHYDASQEFRRTGEAYKAFRQHACRGACVGKESPAMHGARLMAALAKYRLRPWPYPGAIALIERDAFGMHEEAHVIDGWAHLGTACDEATLNRLFEEAAERRQRHTPRPFHPDIYRIVDACLRKGDLRVIQPPVDG